MHACARQATRPTSKSGDILRALRETAQSMHAPSSGGAAGSMPEGEAALRKEREWAEAVQAALWGATKAVRLGGGQGGGEQGGGRSATGLIKQTGSLCRQSGWYTAWTGWQLRRWAQE